MTVVRKYEIYVVDLNRRFTSSEDIKYQLENSLIDTLIHAFLKKEVEIEWDEDSELNKTFPEQEKIEELLNDNR